MQCSSILHPTNPIFAPNIANNTHSCSFVKHNSKFSFQVAAQFNRFQLKKSVTNNLRPQFLVNNKENTAARLFPTFTSTRVLCTSDSEGTSSPEDENSISTPEEEESITTILLHEYLALAVFEVLLRLLFRV